MRCASPPEPISEALFATMTNQHVAITGTLQAKLGVAIATTEDALLKREHQHAINTEALQLLDEIPQTPILLSMPRIEPKTAIQNNINMTPRFAGITPPICTPDGLTNYIPPHHGQGDEWREAAMSQCSTLASGKDFFFLLAFWLIF